MEELVNIIKSVD